MKKNLIYPLSCLVLLLGLLCARPCGAQPLSEQPPPGPNPDLGPVPPPPPGMKSGSAVEQAKEWAGHPRGPGAGVVPPAPGPRPVGPPLPPEVLKKKLEDWKENSTLYPPHPAKHWNTPNGLPPEEYRAPRVAPQSVTDPAPIYNQFQGASWTPGMYPMDLSAAVSGLNPNISGSGPYLTQLTNNGLYVWDKVTGILEDNVSLYKFWCSVPGVNGSTLSDCPSSSATAIFDTQIAYNWRAARWITTTMSPDGTYVWVGASETADPRGDWFLWSFQACPHYQGQGAVTLDQPILGISAGIGASPGRVVVGMRCYVNGIQQADDLYDFVITDLQAGKTSPAFLDLYPPSFWFTNPTLTDLRPVINNFGANTEIILSTLTFPSTTACSGNPNLQCGQPELWVFRLEPGSSGPASDKLVNYTGSNGSSPFMTGVTVVNNVSVLAPQPSPNLPIETEELETDNGDMIDNAYSCTSTGCPDNFFATSFAAQQPDMTDSYYVAFALNLANGYHHFFAEPFASQIVAFPSVVIDNDNELWINYTVFSGSSPAFANVDLYDFAPVENPPGYVNTYPFVDSQAPITSACTAPTFNPCTIPGTACCRWGDYTTNVFDESCGAANQGLTSECFLFWSAAEYTPDGTTQASQVTGWYDQVLKGDTK